MGNAQSPATNQRFITASRAFSKEELENLRSLFGSLASQSQSDRKFISQSVFQAYYGIHGALMARLFQLITQERNDGMLTFEDLIISKATYEKGIPDEIEDFIYRLCDVNGDGALGRYIAQVSTKVMVQSQLIKIKDSNKNILQYSSICYLLSTK